MDTRDYIKEWIYKQHHIVSEVDACYLYFEELIRANLTGLKKVFPEQFEIFYAMKANPYADIVSLLGRLGCGFDVASAGELEIAIREGGDKNKISFAGPGKTDEDFMSAAKNGIYSLSIENFEEIDKINTIAKANNKKQGVAVRVNPQKIFSGYGMKMGGYPSPFGIDEDKCPYALKKILESDYLEFVGFHMHVGSQILDANNIGKVILYLFEYALNIQSQFNVKIKYLNFGGGFGVPYYENQNSLDLNQLQNVIENIINRDDIRRNFSETRFVVEPGRFLVANAGVYLSKILYIKESIGKKFIVIAGGMHHNMAACGLFGQVIRRNYDIDILRFHGSFHKTESEQFDIVGSLCTPLDRLAENIHLTDVRVGDYICVYNSGGYGYTASPLFFLGHPLPKEFLVPTHEGRKE